MRDQMKWSCYDDASNICKRKSRTKLLWFQMKIIMQEPDEYAQE